MMKPALYAALFVTFALSAPAHAQTTTGTQSQGAGSEATGSLPEGSLAQKRQGAIGGTEQGVRQQDDTAAADSAGTGKLPQNSLPAERQGAIGDAPKPATQGGSGSSQ